MRNVMVGTPAHDGRLDVWYVNSLLGTIDLCGRSDIKISPIFMSFDSLIQRARNDLVLMAIEHEVDDLLFIDSDEKWEPEWVLSLLRHEVDAVGAAVRKKTDAIEEYNVRASGPNIPVDAKTGLWLVDGVGTGFLRLSNKALHALWDRSQTYKKDSGIVSRMVFNVEIKNGRLVGEDIGMCNKLHASGIQVYIDPSFTVTHIGPKEFTGDFPSYIERLKAKAA